MATILLLSGPEPEPARRARARALRHDHARRARRARDARPRPSSATMSSTCSRTTKACSSTRSTARAGAARRSCSTPGAFTHYAYALTDALADVRRREDRGAPLEPARPRGVAAPSRWSRRSSTARSPASAPRATGSRSKRSADLFEETKRSMNDRHRARPARRSPGRLGRLRERLADVGVDALLVTKLANVRYLTGLHRLGRDAARARPTTRCSSPTAATPSRRRSSSARPASTRAIEIGLTGGRAARGARRGGRAGHAARARGAQRHLGRAARASSTTFAGVELVPAGALVEDLRRVKDAGEVDRIRRACAIADDAFQSLLPRLADGHHRAPVRARARVRDARARRERQQLRSDHRGRARTARSRTRGRRDRVDRPQRARRVRLRLHRRRLLLRHDAHGVASAIPGPTRVISTTSCSRASRPGRDVGRRRRRVRRHRSRRRATSSPTPAGPRRSRTRPVTVSVSRSTRRRGWPRPAVIPCSSATSSRSSRVSTSPASAACASRTPSSSPRRVPSR